jgi:hypothetical protein
MSEGIQSKRCQQFAVADLGTAVDKYTQSAVPFRLVRFVVCVSTKVDDRAVVERKSVLNEQHHPFEIEIWDQSRISEMLRDKLAVVAEGQGRGLVGQFGELVFGVVDMGQVPTGAGQHAGTQ